jgi:hypothetical protein
LKPIHDFFLKHSIPFNIIEGLDESFANLLTKIKTINKPDLIVLDLDLNSNGEIDNYDIDLIHFIISSLKANYYEFIILIYSSEEDSWDDVKSELLKKDYTLEYLLSNENVIRLQKSPNWNAELTEKLDVEINSKAVNYFTRQIEYINEFMTKTWNKEGFVVLFFLFVATTAIHFTFRKSNTFLFILAISIMVITTLVYVSESKKRKK